MYTAFAVFQLSRAQEPQLLFVFMFWILIFLSCHYLCVESEMTLVLPFVFDSRECLVNVYLLCQCSVDVDIHIDFLHCKRLDSLCRIYGEKSMRCSSSMPAKLCRNMC